MEGYKSKSDSEAILNFDSSKLTKEKLEEYLNEIFNKNCEHYYKETDIGNNLLKIESGNKDEHLSIIVNKKSYNLEK